MMAAASSTSPPSTTPQPRPFNASIPVPLSAAHEAQVRALYYKRVRSYCATEIKEFADCARNRTFSATWVCRQQRLAMNGCMIAHAGRDEEDKAREEWFVGRQERREKREKEEREVEVRRKEVLDMMEMDRREEEGKRRGEGR